MSKIYDRAGGVSHKIEKKKNYENTKNPALNPSFELGKRTRSGQPAEDLELKLGCRLCGSPCFLSAFLISRYEVWLTALGANYFKLLFLQLRTEAKKHTRGLLRWDG